MPSLEPGVVPLKPNPSDPSGHSSLPEGWARFTELQAGLGPGGSWQKLSGFI